MKALIIAKDINSPEFIKTTNLLHDCGFQFTTNPAEADWIVLCPCVDTSRIISIGEKKIEQYRNFKNFTYNNFPAEILS